MFAQEITEEGLIEKWTTIVKNTVSQLIVQCMFIR